LQFTPHTVEDIERALAAIGIDSLEELFTDIPSELLDPPFDLPVGMDEVSLRRHLQELAAKNRTDGPNFLGGGAARHFLPAVTEHLAAQGAFVTAYTPYQPEVSQGILQATFEYQTMMAELTGLAVSNASMYDGASAVAEAALLAMRATRRNRVVVCTGVHPQSREVLQTYLTPLEAKLEQLPLDPLLTPTPTLSKETACLIVQNPNFLGYLEDMPRLAAAAHRVGALFIAVVDPLSLALLVPPGSYGADVAVGDGQTLGNPLNFGGPAFGFMTVTKPLLRQLPGRLVGQTIDRDGNRAFVLTLQAREQHIRRSKARSNICSNHQLTALMATINLAALGPTGLVEVATASIKAAHKLATRLAETGIRVVRDARFFNEFVIELSGDPQAFRRQLAEQGIHAGVPVPAEYGLGPAVLLAATELTPMRR